VPGKDNQGHHYREHQVADAVVLELSLHVRVNPSGRQDGFDSGQYAVARGLPTDPPGIGRRGHGNRRRRRRCRISILAMAEAGFHLGNGLCPVVHIKFLEDVPQMVFYCIDANSQDGSNLGIRFTHPDPAQ
jgi:hypothetical protein